MNPQARRRLLRSVVIQVVAAVASLATAAVLWSQGSVVGGVVFAVIALVPAVIAIWLSGILSGRIQPRRPS